MKYRVTVEYGGRAEAIVEADNEQEAEEIGRGYAMDNIGIDSANTNIRSVTAEGLDPDDKSETDNY